MKKVIEASVIFVIILTSVVYTNDAEVEPKKAEPEILHTSSVKDEGFCPYEYLTDVCNRYGVDTDDMLALIKIESNFNPDLISTTNDYGLTQINVCNHERLRKELGVTDFLDPKQNIECGVYLIAELQEKYREENFNKTLMRYNLGEAGAKRLFNKGIFETHYTKKHKIALENKDWGW
jgi:soluble lytic murein transglycosylase-like protein